MKLVRQSQQKEVEREGGGVGRRDGEGGGGRMLLIGLLLSFHAITLSCRLGMVLVLLVLLLPSATSWIPAPLILVWCLMVPLPPLWPQMWTTGQMVYWQLIGQDSATPTAA